jgi:putative methylase
MSKKELAISLSKLDVFSSPKIMEEQYPTDSNIAADILWFADLVGDIENKTIADLGAGTGILGIGCIIMGAKKVFFIEKDSKAIQTLQANLDKFDLSNYKIIEDDINFFEEKVDLVVQNPPFGTKKKHVDIEFLEHAMSISNKIYSFHKAETKDYIDQFIHKKAFRITNYFEFDFPLKNSMDQHKKKVEFIKVGCWRIEKE